MNAASRRGGSERAFPLRRNLGVRRVSGRQRARCPCAETEQNSTRSIATRFSNRPLFERRRARRRLERAVERERAAGTRSGRS